MLNEGSGQVLIENPGDGNVLTTIVGHVVEEKLNCGLNGNYILLLEIFNCPINILLEYNLEGPLEGQGDCRGGIKTILIKLEVYYSPAEEELRLGVFFCPQIGRAHV